jgi:hypothetical protein
VLPSDTVTVETAPPEINTSNAVLGRTVEPDEIVGLPLVNRNIYTEVSLTPGVMANNNSPSSNPTGTPTTATGLYIEDVQINGSIDGGSAEVAFYLDGGNNITGMRNYGNPSPDPDAVEEFRVETSAFGAQYGQFSAAVVSVITKSGTNKLAWRCVRVQPQHRLQRQSAGPRPITPPADHRFALPPQPVWRFCGRPHQEGQGVLLLQLWRIAPDNLSSVYRRSYAHRQRTPGRLYRRHLHGLHAGHQSRRIRWTEPTAAPTADVPKLNCIPQALLDTTIPTWTT